MSQRIRNPSWSRDELILALELYFDVEPGFPTSATDQRILQLSRELNGLPVSGVMIKGDRFRNPNGAYMKLCNFRRFDPALQSRGLVGLRGGAKLEETLWNEFKSNRELLHREAARIRESLESSASEDSPFDPESTFPEGRKLYRLHLARERSARLVSEAKRRFLLKHGRLRCEVCGFDFEAVYGDAGKEFIEAHHDVPVSSLEEGGETRIEDLSLLCSNCHGIIHRRRPWLSVEELTATMLQRWRSQNGPHTQP